MMTFFNSYLDKTFQSYEFSSFETSFLPLVAFSLVNSLKSDSGSKITGYESQLNFKSYSSVILIMTKGRTLCVCVS